MKLRRVPTNILRALLLLRETRLLPAFCLAIENELADREWEERAIRSPMIAAMREKANLRASGHDVWMGLGGDS